MNIGNNPESFKLHAAMLALLVHVVFFVLLYFGLSWHTEPMVVASVELWQSLPDSAPEVHQRRHVESKPAPAPAPAPVVIEEVKPEIIIPEKKPLLRVEKKPEKLPVKIPEKVTAKILRKIPELKPVEKPSVKPAIKPKSVAKPPTGSSADFLADLNLQSSQKPAVTIADRQVMRDQIAQEAENGLVVDEFIAKIKNKIKSNIVLPPNVPDNASATFSVTLLPGGHVLRPNLKQSSGNAAYDAAVERAILRSDPLPLPADAGLFGRFRELNLKFKPVE
jgi:colicin import membrane protein